MASHWVAPGKRFISRHSVLTLTSRVTFHLKTRSWMRGRDDSALGRHCALELLWVWVLVIFVLEHTAPLPGYFVSGTRPDLIGECIPLTCFYVFIFFNKKAWVPQTAALHIGALSSSKALGPTSPTHRSPWAWTHGGFGQLCFSGRVGGSGERVAPWGLDSKVHTQEAEAGE